MPHPIQREWNGGLPLARYKRYNSTGSVMR